MTRGLKWIYAPVLAAALLSGVSKGAPKAPLVLIHTTPLPDIDGDFDHFAVDVKGNRLFLTAEDHHSVEVFELGSGKFLRSLGGFSTPHSVRYMPEQNELLVVDGGDGSCKVVRGDNYQIIKTLKVGPEADSMGYDPSTKRLFIGAGGEEAKMDHSLLVAVDGANGKTLGEMTINSGNIEAMAVEKSGPKLFANIRDKHQIGVIDREKMAMLTTWTLAGVQLNTTMALDEANHRLLIAGRKPGKLAVLDSDSGKIIATFPCVDGADDMSLDIPGNRLYITGAEGFADVFERISPDQYRLLAKVPTGYRGKNSVLVPEIKQFYVSSSKHENKPAELKVYRVE